jgi:phenylalanyl-tRNA synthetase beta chain
VVVPSFRQDVELLADLCEEVARVYGYERIPETRLADELPPPYANVALGLEQGVRAALVGAGLTELITHSLIDMPLVASVAPSEAVAERYVTISNPNTPEKTAMRRSLLPSLGAALAMNLRERERAAVFEIGRVYLPVEQPGTGGNWLPAEPRRLAIAMAGPREPEAWNEPRREAMDFFDLKGVVETLVERLGLANRVSYAPLTDDERFHPGRSAALLLETGEEAGSALQNGTDESRKGRIATLSQRVGVLGELHPAARERLELSVARVAVAELDLEALLEAAAQPTFRPVSRFPATVQDLSIVAPAEVPEARIAALIRRGAGELLERLTLFDRYTGPQVGEGKRSLTYRLVFRASDRTLSDEALAKVRKKIIGGLEREIGATIRG